MTQKPDTDIAPIPTIICTVSKSDRFKVGDSFVVEGGSPFGSVMAISNQGVLHSFFATKDDLYYCPSVGDTSIDQQYLFELVAV